LPMQPLERGTMPTEGIKEMSGPPEFH
jgi:hypothetical protein